MDEKEAIRLLKQGQIKGLETLVNHYQTRGLRAAFLILDDQDLAEDIVSDAFLRAYQKINQFDLHRPFGPWFFQIVTNLAKRAASRNNRSTPFSAVPPTLQERYIQSENQADASPEDQVAEDDRQDQLRKAIMALSPGQRTVIVQKYFLNLSIAEIASNTLTPQGTIKWRLHTAYKRLRILLEAEENDHKGENDGRS